ncbi:DUF4349 domain-containing protein [Synergistaceae bacterium OttesenSCG-928-I11]|nr:DUF4349 domain-containing protein [Synergistaceae bacterium OttesenSCG-928-I11]
MAQRGGAGKKALVFILLFIVFFLGRLGYGYYTTPDKIVKRSARSRVPEVSVDLSSSKKNYATDKLAQRTSASAMPQVDQKYEKTATVVTGTKEYDKDEGKLRATIKEHGAIVQFEHNVGRSDVKTRVLQLMIGVQPDSFDKFYAAAREIGRLESAEVTKVDKTNEFLDLKAQRESLENTRRALMELKRMNGSIDELVNLQYRILEIDQQLQNLGVKLGDYDEVNEFCTVRLTMYEDHDILVYPPTTPRRVMIAFKWSLKYYFAAMAALAFFSIFAFFSVAIAEKIRGWADPYGRHERFDDEPETEPATQPAEPEKPTEPEKKAE